MIEILAMISLWCSGDSHVIKCKREILACVSKDLKPGDYDSKTFLAEKLLKCIKLK